MENNHLGRKAALDDKSPEMQRTLDAIKFLQSKKVPTKSKEEGQRCFLTPSFEKKKNAYNQPGIGRGAHDQV